MLLSPIFNDPIFLDNNGDPLAGGRIFQYEAGSFSVLQATFADESGTVGNPNPIILDSSGRLPGETAIWLTPGSLYNLVLTAPNGTTVLKSFDNVSGVLVAAGGSGPTSSTVWVERVATFLSPSAFLVTGNLTAEFAVGNRVRVLQAGPTFVYGTVNAVSFSSGNTSVTLIGTTAPLNASLTRADHSVLIAVGSTVDAAGVSYNAAFNYTDPLSIGFEVKDLRADLTAEELQVNRLNTTWGTSGTGANTPFTITPSPAATSLTADSTWSVRFVAAGAGDATLNINGLGAKRLRTYNPAGALINATIPVGFVSTVTYDVTNDCYIVQNRLPEASQVVPRGLVSYDANTTWTCPPGVFFVKATCIGGGGGGGYGIAPDTVGRGGNGAYVFNVVPVTPGVVYNIVIGAGGQPSNFPPTPGGAGGTTSFGGTLVTAGGGGGGNNAAQGADSSSGTGYAFAMSWPAGQLGPYGLGGNAGLETFAGAGVLGLCILEW